jgi:hypothetical protein
LLSGKMGLTQIDHDELTFLESLAELREDSVSLPAQRQDLALSPLQESTLKPPHPVGNRLQAY